MKTAVCPYTVTPDSRFVIDRLPAQPNVIVASPCSGHGFKHSAAIGESLAQLATTGASSIDLTPFALPADARPDRVSPPDAHLTAVGGRMTGPSESSA